MELKTVNKDVRRTSQEYMEHLDVSVYYLSDIGDEALGLKLIVDCIHASYAGVINRLINHQNRIDIWLEQACLLTTGYKFIGLIKVNSHDVLNIKIVGLDHKAKKIILSNFQSNLKSRNFLMKRVLPIEHIEDDGLEIELSFEDFIKDLQSNIRSDEFLSSNCIIVDSLDEKFGNIMACINKESVIGLSYVGTEMGRLGKLAWLGISTSQSLYLIDIAKISMEICMEKGLKEIFVNQRLCKVVDDSRYLHDYLIHQHNCSLCNVFDVKASEIYVYMMKNNSDVPCLLSSLSSLLHNYLNHNCDILEKYLTPVEEETTWFERPLLNSLTNRLMYSTMFLMQLRDKMISALLVENNKITSIFLNSQVSKATSLVNQCDKSVVPFELQNLNRLNRNKPDLIYIRNKTTH